KHLSSIEITHAVLGLVARKPGWAGHAATLLNDLRTAGGRRASFAGAITLGNAIERLLTNKEARESMRSLMVSSAVSGTNVNGYAVLSLKPEELARTVHYVSKMALSLLQPGGEDRIERDGLHAPASSCLIFSRTFFETLARRIQQSESMPTAVEGDGSEYDVEESKQARYRALGVTSRSQFFNVGVETQVTWPRQEQRIRFDKYDLILMPKTRDSTQSVHVDLHANRIDESEAMTVVNRLLSVLSWCDDQFAVVQDGWSGSPVPMPVPRRNLAFATAHAWPFDRHIANSDQVRRALAHYREGCNAEAAALGSYAVLSFFKTIEVKYRKPSKVQRWIRDHFAEVATKSKRDPAFEHFVSTLEGTLPEEYLNDACRVAVAHASVRCPSDSDDATETTRLNVAAHVLRLLARQFIASELLVSDIVFSGK
ncbi:MAG: methylamine utilization protein MauJ, partial [Pyrinomonadaceae bacterium]